MKRRIIIAAAFTVCLALWAAVWPQAETVGETPAPPQTPAASAPEPVSYTHLDVYKRQVEHIVLLPVP